MKIMFIVRYFGFVIIIAMDAFIRMFVSLLIYIKVDNISVIFMTAHRCAGGLLGSHAKDIE